MRRIIVNCASRLCPCLTNSCIDNSKQDEEDSFSDLISEPKYEWKNTVPFVPPITSGNVIKVYDGDTITIATTLPYPNSPLYRFPVRLNGIDAPEMHGKNDDEKEAAKNSQRALERLILHNDVVLKNIQTEKYGRILADVYLENNHVNQWLLDNHYAVKYDGGTKHTPKSWLKFQETGKPD